MARLILTIPDDILDRVYNGVAKSHRYQGEIRNSDYDSMYPDRGTKFIANPESRDDFVKRMVGDFLMRSVQKAESDTAREAAEKSAKDEVAL